MFSPLLENIIEREKLTVVNEDNLDLFLQDSGDVILFIAGDARRLVEVDDVAVILPELVKAFQGRLTPAVVERNSERAVQLRYRFNAFPALVFLRNGEYLGVITKVMDWIDYLNSISDILSADPVDIPPYKFPEGCAPAA